MELHYELYFLLLLLIHGIYILVYLGILSSIPKYISYLHISVQLFLCLFLMFWYHPFRKTYNFKPVDAKLIFGAALLLLVNLLSAVPPIIYFNNMQIKLPALQKVNK